MWRGICECQKEVGDDEEEEEEREKKKEEDMKR